MAKANNSKKWIQGAVPDENKGLLHKKLGIKPGEKIPASKLAIKPTDSTKLKREKNFAKNVGKLGKKK